MIVLRRLANTRQARPRGAADESAQPACREPEQGQRQSQPAAPATAFVVSALVLPLAVVPAKELNTSRSYLQ